MISKSIGKILKQDTKTRVVWPKLAVALVLSNVFFFLLFSGGPEVAAAPGVPPGWVEMQLEADLLTPFQTGKRVLLVHRLGRRKLEAVLQQERTEVTGRITVLVKEDEAHALLQFQSWEILPYLKNLSFASVKKEESHEIRY